jgi:hypothetical protein
VSRTARISTNHKRGSSCWIFEVPHFGPKSFLSRHAQGNAAAIKKFDCVVGDFSKVSVGFILLAGVSAGTEVMIGAGTINLEDVIAGDHADTGASSAVSKDAPGVQKSLDPGEVLLQF